MQTKKKRERRAQYLNLGLRFDPTKHSKMPIYFLAGSGIT
jgi:hypothetical protein